MTAQPAGEPTDSPVWWVAEHIRDYVASDGARGHLFRERPTARELPVVLLGRR
jgi:hypothetical protein